MRAWRAAVTGLSCVVLPIHGSVAQVAVGAITGSTSYSKAVSGYVAILDLGSGHFAPVVTQRSEACRRAGNGQVSLLTTKEFASQHQTLLAITANAGPGLSKFTDGLCGTPAGLIVSNGAVVNPGETGGPVLYFTNTTQAMVTDGLIPPSIPWAVAGTTATNNDCPDQNQFGTLLVNAGVPGACAIPKATIAAGRGAVGLDSTGTLLIVAVVEGGESAGLKTLDLANLLIGLGAVRAINLDGGGSTVFYWTPSGSAPALSARAAQAIRAARFPVGRPNPNDFSFTMNVLDQTQDHVFDAIGRPIYASLGFTYVP